MSAVATMHPEQLRVPPYSLEAEGSVLGGLMLDNALIDEVSDIVSSEDFYTRANRLVYATIFELLQKALPVDVITVSEALKVAGDLDEIGGLGYLGHLVKNTAGTGGITTYAAIVHDRAQFREAIQVGFKIQELAFTPSDENWAEINKLVMGIGTERETQGLQGVNAVLRGTVDRIEQLFQNEGALAGLSTGFAELDELTTGLQNSDLIIVAGRPAMGKTSFAMNIVEHVALVEEKPVAVFSMEMPAEMLMMRLIASVGRVPLQDLRSGNLNDDHWPSITNAISRISNSKLAIDETGGLTPQQLSSRARRHMRHHGQLGLIVVDYLQLMTVPGTKENRTGEISEISRSLKALAKELNVPVIALSQLNRGLEQRPNKRPVLADLRESGAIEQDADLITFIYRDEVYNPESDDKGKAEIIIGKQRNGPIDSFKLAFLGEYTRFENYAQDRFGEVDDFTQKETPPPHKPYAQTFRRDRAQ